MLCCSIKVERERRGGEERREEERRGEESRGEGRRGAFTFALADVNLYLLSSLPVGFGRLTIKLNTFIIRLKTDVGCK